MAGRLGAAGMDGVSPVARAQEALKAATPRLPPAPPPTHLLLDPGTCHLYPPVQEHGAQSWLMGTHEENSWGVLFTGVAAGIWEEWCLF